jgi:hypothetical protein
MIVVQTMEKTVLFFLIGVHVVRNIARELCEMSDILTHGHRSLL